MRGEEDIALQRSQPLQARHFFHVWDADANEVRWMTSWSTRPEDVDSFAASMREVLGR